MLLLKELLGSPPHTRGKVAPIWHTSTFNRITPAYAGKRLRSTAGTCKLQDHPRIRGEKTVAGITRFRARGSPPHTRGKGLSYYELLCKVGITPAYAGKSRQSMYRTSSPRDHPRIRGEKSPGIAYTQPRPGSPPHTRGKALDIYKNS